MQNKFLIGLALLASYGAGSILAQTNTADDEPEIRSGVAMWVWTDKYIYSPGEKATIRWTIKNAEDPNQYTLFLLRQDNQDGKRYYLPSAGEAATDIFNKSASDGYQTSTLPNAEKEILVGEGGRVASVPLSLFEDYGMHTVIAQIRDRTGTRVLKSAYFKFGIVRGTEQLPNVISSNRTLTNDRAYRISGIVQVNNNAVLTVQPGTFIIGTPGSQPPSVLLVSTSGRLVAEGTRSRPIIMTSSQPFGQRQRGDWGGLIMLGKARLNDPSGSLFIEGLPDSPDNRYGGDDDNHNCGSLRYVRVEFAGSLLRPNEETNSFTWGGCGKGTKSEFLQATYGLDDSFEWFGGNNDAKYLVGTYGADDYIDTQIGYRGRIQYVVGVANSDLSNRGIEADNYERDFAARPLGKSGMYNFTFVGNAHLGSGSRGYDEADAPCIYTRRGAGGIYNNMLCFNWTTRTYGGADFASIQPNMANGDYSISGVVSWDNGRNVTPTPRANTIEDQVLPAFLPYAQDTARKIVFANPNLRRPIEYSDPDFRPRLGSAVLRTGWTLSPDDGFFDQFADYAGAFNLVDWTEEWTVFIQEQDMKP
ncbi:MAG: hypothetical protein NTV70_14515 [Acidobacteria bacterium]|nr:hypothetical protein [Acidobacteriota bacterium]